jgi:hypothetical protein
MDATPEQLLALGAAIVLAGFAAWTTLAGARTAARATPDEALATCRLLLGLLRNLQQHRGMSSAWLAGDASFETRMQDRRREVSALLGRLEQACALEQKRPCPCPSRAAVEAFRQRWNDLTRGLSGHSVEDSIARHSFLIASLLEWLSAYGEARLSPLLGAGSSAVLARNFAFRLPAVTEALGQARAIGSSVAARKGCPPVARVRLMFLVARAEALVGQAASGAAGNSERRARDSAARRVGEMARVVRSEMLMSAGVSVTADEYFALATESIDAVFAWIDACAQDLAHDLADRRRGPASLAQAA